MSLKPLEYLKPITDEYARLIAEGSKFDDMRLVSLRKELGFDTSQMDENKTEFNKNIKVRNRVGIWDLDNRDGEKYFIKSTISINEARNWADIEEIYPKREKRRIAFLGESVARGYFYDPYYCPASVLEDIINQNLSNEKVEVIDLAKVSIRIEELQEVTMQSIELEPDYIVVFAGNNWRKSVWSLSNQEVDEIVSIMDTNERFEQIQALLEKSMKNKINQYMRKLHEITTIHKIPVLFIIPEFNLKDWKSNASERILCWPGGRTGEWLVLKEKAQQALENGNYDVAEKLAEKMVKVNRANPLGYEILGEINLRNGSIMKSREYFELAVDTALFRLGTPPSTTVFIQKEIMEQASRYGIDIVDLPNIFSNNSANIPGNDLFIDYCHLTVKGIDISMQHTAHKILQRWGITEMPITQSKIKLNSEVMSKAHFLSAVHCAHSGDQPYEALYYHCMKALQHSNDIEEMMVKYIDLATRKVPWVLNKNYEMMFKQKYTGIRQMGDCKIMDIKLVDAMVNALKTVGIDIKKQTDELRIREHQPVPNKGVNLLETYYRENSYFNAFSVSKSVDYDNRNQCFISARDTISSFSMIADNQNDLKASITFRIPIEGTKDKKVHIKVNGNSVMKTLLSDKWSDFDFKIPKALLKEGGINQITVEWPLFDEMEKVITEEYQKRYSGCELILQRSRPVYGEIIRFNIAV